MFKFTSACLLAVAASAETRSYAAGSTHSRDPYYLDENMCTEYLRPDLNEDLKHGIGEYGQHNSDGLRYILNSNEQYGDQPRTQFALDKDASAFAGPGCFEGNAEHSGKVVTFIPATCVETKTYTQE